MVLWGEIGPYSLTIHPPTHTTLCQELLCQHRAHFGFPVLQDKGTPVCHDRNMVLCFCCKQHWQVLGFVESG